MCYFSFTNQIHSIPTIIATNGVHYNYCSLVGLSPLNPEFIWIEFVSQLAL